MPAAKTPPAPVAKTPEQIRALKLQPAAASVTYVPPRPKVTDWVLWFRDWREPTCYPAMVVGLGEDAIQIAVILPGRETLLALDAVRHKQDPRKKLIEDVKQGVWEACDAAPMEAGGDQYIADLIATANDAVKRLGHVERRATEVDALKEKIAKFEEQVNALTHTVAGLTAKK